MRLYVVGSVAALQWVLCKRKYAASQEAQASRVQYTAALLFCLRFCLCVMECVKLRHVSVDAVHIVCVGAGLERPRRILVRLTWFMTSRRGECISLVCYLSEGRHDRHTRRAALRNLRSSTPGLSY